MRAAVYGHRGARGERAENTIAGFLHAVDCGVAGIETDIAMTADFIPVLHHDARLSDGRLIRETTFADLPGEIPALAQALAQVPAGEWLLEIKTYPDAPDETHPAALMVAKTLAAMGEMDRGRVSILAFDWAVLRALTAQATGLRRVCLTAPETAASREVWWGPGFERLSLPRAVAAAGAGAWAGFHDTMSAAEVVEAHGLGLRVLAWTVNEARDFTRLAPLVDGIITDYPGRFLKSPSSAIGSD